MNAPAVGAVVFLCCFGGAALGMYLGVLLPKDHLSAESKEGVKVAIAMVATLSALVIGLLVAFAKTSFDSKNSEYKRTISLIVLLDRTMAHYGPETRDARDLLRQWVAGRLGEIWAPGTAEQIDPDAIGKGPGLEDVQDRLWALSAGTDAQTWLRSRALQLTGDISEARATLLQQIDSGIPWPFLAILIFWLTLIFASFGLFAARNATVLAALFACALSVAGALFLILQLDQPYSGLIKISSAPLRAALLQLGGT